MFFYKKIFERIDRDIANQTVFKRGHIKAFIEMFTIRCICETVKSYDFQSLCRNNTFGSLDAEIREYLKRNGFYNIWVKLPKDICKFEYHYIIMRGNVHCGTAFIWTGKANGRQPVIIEKNIISNPGYLPAELPCNN